MRAHPRSLAGATILQTVPALRDDSCGHAALDIALTLLQAGARAIVAGAGGPLVDELRAIGGEWLPMVNSTLNPLRIHLNAKTIAGLIASERVDIVHAHSAASAWSALIAVHKQPVFLVTSLPDRLPGYPNVGTLMRGSLTRGHRVIAPSTYVARAMIERYKLAAESIKVIPPAVDTAEFSPAAVSAERIAVVRRVWGVLPNMRVVFVPGRIAPWNGQMNVIDAAPLIIGNGERNVIFVFAGEKRMRPYARHLRQQARARDIDTLCRFVGPCADMPAALAAADVVAMPALQPPLSGRLAAETQAMGRPLVASAVGMLPENVLCPPRMREELRTGWLVRPGDVEELALAVRTALAVNLTAYEAMGARARQFAEFMFSPQNVAEAIRGVYTSLLSRDA